MLKRLINWIFPRSYVVARHGALGRSFMGSVAFCATLGVTRSPILAQEVFATFRRDDFVTGLARLAWYSRRRFPRTDMSSDPLHLFCSGMRPRELDAMRGFLARQSGHLSPEVVHGELAMISATTAAETLALPRYPSDLAQLRADTGALLALGLTQNALDPRPDPVPEPQIPPQRQALDRDQAEAALRDMLRLLEAEGFRPFMLSGTLLGAVREGRILDHDYDIDLGFLAGGTDLARLERILRQSPTFGGLRMEYQTLVIADGTSLKRVDIPVIYKIRHAGGVTVDLFLHYREQDEIWHGTTLFRWSNSAFSLAPRALGPSTLLAPADAAKHLAENYGDWQTRKYAFHCGLDTPNLVLHQGPMALAVAVRRLAMLGPRREDAARLIAQMEAAGFIERDTAESWRISRTIFSLAPRPISADDGNGNQS